MQLINTILNDRYLVLEKIGSGGMATVFKAKDNLLDRVVAVKVLNQNHLDDEDTIRKFRREARAAGSLSHFNIVGVFDVGQHEDTHYIVMELAEGNTLKDYITAKGKVEESKAIDIVLQICDALIHAHENGVIHRDIKPQNIILSKEGKAKVADFGIARAVSSDTLTKTEDIYGSVRYFSPEQASGNEVDFRTDQYSLGIVLFEMLTGQLPFKGETPIEWALKHINDKPASIKDILPDINKDLSDIVMKTLQKEPNNRFNSIEEFAYNLKKYREGIPVKLTMPKKRTSTTQNKNSKKKLLNTQQKIVFALILVAFIGVGAYLGIQWLNDYLTVPEVYVPDLVGEYYEDAVVRLQELGLDIETTISQNHPTIPEDHIIRQRPEAGVLVKEGRLITLTISEGVGFQRIPEIITFSLSDAEAALQRLGFEIGEIREEYHDDISEGSVIDINPRPGTEVKAGTEVALIISLGKDEDTVTVPNIIGMTNYMAQQALLDAGLTIGNISESRSEKPADTVIEQGVRAGISVLPDTAIDFIISDGRTP
jgi:serine/threonine-protein kinase